MTIPMVLQCCSKCLKFGGNEILNVQIVQFTRHRFPRILRLNISIYSEFRNYRKLDFRNYRKLQFGNFNLLLIKKPMGRKINKDTWYLAVSLV